jgi:hypothetical protein
MGHWILRVLLLACLAAPVAGQATEWHTYKSDDGNFSALFPLEPKETVNTTENAPPSHTFLAMSGTTGYTVVYVFTKSEQSVDDANFKAYRDGVLGSLPGCNGVTENPAAPAVRGYIGHSYRMNCIFSDVKMSVVGNLYWGKHYGYAALVIFPVAASDPPTVTRFTNSFSVIDSGK